MMRTGLGTRLNLETLTHAKTFATHAVLESGHEASLLNPTCYVEDGSSADKSVPVASPKGSSDAEIEAYRKKLRASVPLKPRLAPEQIQTLETAATLAYRNDLKTPDKQDSVTKLIVEIQSGGLNNRLYVYGEPSLGGMNEFVSEKLANVVFKVGQALGSQHVRLLNLLRVASAEEKPALEEQAKTTRDLIVALVTSLKDVDPTYKRVPRYALYLLTAADFAGLEAMQSDSKKYLSAWIDLIQDRVNQTLYHSQASGFEIDGIQDESWTNYKTVGNYKKIPSYSHSYVTFRGFSGDERRQVPTSPAILLAGDEKHPDDLVDHVVSFLIQSELAIATLIESERKNKVDWDLNFFGETQSYVKNAGLTGTEFDEIVAKEKQAIIDRASAMPRRLTGHDDINTFVYALANGLKEFPENSERKAVYAERVMAILSEVSQSVEEPNLILLLLDAALVFLENTKAEKSFANNAALQTKLSDFETDVQELLTDVQAQIQDDPTLAAYVADTSPKITWKLSPNVADKFEARSRLLLGRNLQENTPLRGLMQITNLGKGRKQKSFLKSLANAGLTVNAVTNTLVSVTGTAKAWETAASHDNVLSVHIPFF
jgi:hypothetical protein